MFGCAGQFDAGDRGRRGRAPAARGGRGRSSARPTTPEFGQWPLTESIACGVTPQPVEPRPHARRVERRLGGGGRGRPRARRRRQRRRRVGADSGGVDRASSASSRSAAVSRPWPDAEAFNGLTCYGPLARTVDDAALMLDVLGGTASRRRAQATAAGRAVRRARRARSPGACGSPSPRRSVQWRAHPPAPRDPGRRPAPGRRPRVARARRLRRRGALRTGRAGARAARSGRGRRMGRARPRRRAPRCAHARSPQGRAGRSTRHVLRPVRAGEPVLRPDIGRIFDACRRRARADDGQAAAAHRRVRRLSHSATDMKMTRACPYALRLERHRLARPERARRAHRGRPADRRPAARPGVHRGPLLSLGRQLEAVERWHERRPTVAV